MEQADSQNLHQHVDFLTSLRPYRNYKNLESLRKTADYIEDHLTKVGLPTSRQSWEVKGNVYENILASYQPQKAKRFIIGAHYDVYKDQPGADDNASGVAGLLEIARILCRQKPELEYGIDLVSFCLEEPPFFRKKEMGSYVHAQSVFDQRQEIIGMIALEMIGYFEGPESEESPDQKLLMVSGIKKYDAFNKRISQLLRTSGYIDSRRLSFADDYRNNGPSDHRNYWKFGYPAAMIIGTGGSRNPNYHRETDRIETLDFKTMTKAVNAILYALINFS